MSRCKACDAILDKNEMVWDEELKMHEDLCRICKKIIADAENEDIFSVYLEDTFDDIVPKSNNEVDDE